MASLRWHHSSCLYPDVFIHNGTAHCRRCNSEYHLSELPVNKTTNVLPAVPPDEPRVQMNLRWPPCVPYARNGVRLLPTDLETAPPQPWTPVADDTARSLIYKDPLAPDEFRLLHILADKDRNGPVHVFLETYKQDNCPRYEAASYTWGGEDGKDGKNGDYTARWPVFVGAYWDVLFQTKNCWDMLHSMRRAAGTYTVWVDALCINQANIQERSTQTTNMRHIYQHCSCMAAYLQPSLPESLALQTLFTRKYFKRVWTIQELLLAPRVRVGGLQFTIDRKTWSYFHVQCNFNRNTMTTLTAPWTRHMPDEPNDCTSCLGLYDLLCLTAHAQTADPRDRLFGILGLLPSSDRSLLPDYSLSFQHIFTGLFAHLIINLEKLHLLFFSAGHAAPASWPSWMPDYRSDGVWKRMFAKPEPAPDAGRFISTELLKLPSKEAYIDKKTPLLCLFRIRMTVDTAFPQPSFSNSVTVDADTAVLTMPLVHVCPLAAQPRRVGQVGNLGVFEVVRGMQNPLYLTAEASLDQVVRSESDHLFIWNHGGFDAPQVHFILRDFHPPSKTYTLVTACPHVFLSRRQANLTDADLVGSQYVPMAGLTQSLHDALRLIQVTLNLYLSVSRYRVDPYDARFFKENQNSILGGFLPDALEHWDLFPLYRGLFNEQEGLSPSLEDIFRSYSNAKFPPCIVDGFLQFSFASQDWTSSIEEKYCYVTAFRGFENPWNWRTDGGEWTPMYRKKGDGQYEFMPTSPTQQTVYVRAPLAAVRAIFGKWMKDMVTLRRNLGCTLDELEKVLRAELTEEQQFVRCPGIFTEDSKIWNDVAKDVELDGSTFRVNIV